jgi:hypothetical protein
MRILIFVLLIVITNSVKFEKPITNNNIDHVKLANMVKDSLSHVHEKVSPHLESVASKYANKLKDTNINTPYVIADRFVRNANGENNADIGGELYLKSQDSFGEDGKTPFTFYSKTGIDYINGYDNNDNDIFSLFVKGENNFHCDFSIDDTPPDEEEEEDVGAWTVRDLYVSAVFNVNAWNKCELSNLSTEANPNDPNDDCVDNIYPTNDGLTIVSFLNVGPKDSLFHLFYDEKVLREFLQNINPDIDVSIRQSAQGSNGEDYVSRSFS